MDEKDQNLPADIETETQEQLSKENTEIATKNEIEPLGKDENLNGLLSLVHFLPFFTYFIYNMCDSQNSISTFDHRRCKLGPYRSPSI